MGNVQHLCALCKTWSDNLQFYQVICYFLILFCYFCTEYVAWVQSYKKPKEYKAGCLSVRPTHPKGRKRVKSVELKVYYLHIVITMLHHDPAAFFLYGRQMQLWYPVPTSQSNFIAHKTLTSLDGRSGLLGCRHIKSPSFTFFVYTLHLWILLIYEAKIKVIMWGLLNCQLLVPKVYQMGLLLANHTLCHIIRWNNTLPSPASLIICFCYIFIHITTNIPRPILHRKVSRQWGECRKKSYSNSYIKSEVCTSVKKASPCITWFPAVTPLKECAGWMWLRAAWSSGWQPCPWQGGWN